MKKGKKNKGLFIVFEGGEGSGKSTQIQRLKMYLEAKGKTVYATREPGGTKLGEALRQLVVENRIGSEVWEKQDSVSVVLRAELLMYEASRAQLVDTEILPRLETGSVVLCDRFADSSTVYQGICKGLGKKTVQKINEFATDGLKPDLVLLLDLPETVGMERVQKRATPMTPNDKMGQAFHKEVRQGFLALARDQRNRFRIVNATRTVDEIALDIASIVDKKLARKK